MNTSDSTKPEQICNICGGVEFGDFAGRSKVQCSSCYSLERTRALYYLIQKEALLKAGSRVLHFAPEYGIAHKVIEKIGSENYDRFDLVPSNFPQSIGVKPFDIVREADKLHSNTYDLILHSHIIEHLPAWPTRVFWNLQRALKPNGMHLFCVPLMRGNYAADFGEIPEDERISKYGQIDHLHKFGDADLSDTLGAIFNLNDQNTGLHIAPELAARHGINEQEMQRTIFAMRKEDWALSL